MKAVLIYQVFGTFGQTDAGCHTCAGPQSVLAVADTNYFAHPDGHLAGVAAQEAFMEEAQPILWVPMKGRPNGVPELKIPLENKAFDAMVSVLANRQVGDPWLTARDGRHWIRLMTDAEFAAFVPTEGGVQLDAENLAYQRGLLR